MKEYMKNLKVDSNPTHDDVEALCSVFAECMGDAWGDGTHVLRRLENAPVASGHVKMVFFHDSEKPKHRRSAKDAQGGSSLFENEFVDLKKKKTRPTFPPFTWT